MAAPNPRPLAFVFHENQDSSDVALSAVAHIASREPVFVFDSLRSGGTSPLLARQDVALGNTISDFRHGDVVHLAGIDANSVMDGHQHFKFIGDENFHHQAGELHVLTEPGQLVVEADLDGNGKPDFQIDVQGVHTLTADDFLL
jgi:hypothetical protein